MAYLYRHIRLDKNEPFYIGIGSGETPKRAFNAHQRSVLWKRIASKGFEVEIITEDISWEEACDKERYFISLYGRIDIGTGILANMTIGGEGNVGRVISQKEREKRSEISKQNWKSGVFTEEILKKKYENIKRKYASGELVPHNKGKKVSAEAREHLSKTHMGYKPTAEQNRKISETLRRRYAAGELICPNIGKKSKLTREQSEAKGRKISMAKMGHTHTDEARLKISETLKAKHSSGELTPVGKSNLGRKKSAETRSNMAAGQRARWDSYRKNKQ